MLKIRSSLLTAFLICASLTCSYANPAVPNLEAARMPGADLNRILDNLQKNRLDRELKRDMENSKSGEKPAEVAPAVEQAVPETRLKLKTVEFTESSVLTKEKLQEFASSYENREIGIAELKEFIGRINAWYRSHGYITAMAILPPQEIKDGILKVGLIEGKIGNVKIDGNKSTRSNYIRNRVTIPQGKLLDIRALDRDLAWFNGTNDLKVRIKLQAGEKPGTTDCFILAYEPKSKVGTLFTDTAGNKSTGEMRTGLSYTDYSATGNRDAFNMTVLMSSSSKAGMLSYNLPVNRRGTKVSVYHNFNNLLIDNDGLEIQGSSKSTGFSVSHPVKISTRFKSELVFDALQQNSENNVFGINFVNDKEKRYSIGQSFLKMSPGQAIYLKPVVTFCKYDGLGENKSVQKYALDGLWQKVISGKQQLNLRINGQKAKDEFLPSADQFFLGGLYSVRGYDESIIGGDSGMNLKLDYLFPIKGLKTTRMFTFYDWGRIYGKSFQTTRMIHSFGFGFSHSFLNDSQIVLTLGYPIAKEIGNQAVDPQVFELSMNISF